MTTTTTTTKTQRWYPPPFDRPGDISKTNLDLALKTAYDNVYGLSNQAVLGAVTGLALAYGATTVTGSSKQIGTGLAQVLTVVAGIDSTVTISGDVVTARPSPNLKSGIDLFVWNGASPSGNARSVRWIALGTPINASP